MKTKTRKDKSKLKNKKNNKEIGIFGRKKGSIKINFIDTIIADIIYVFLFISKCLIIINFGNQINSTNIFYSYSKISLKIKGANENAILGNNKEFSGINYLKKVYINGEKQDNITYRYSFNQTDNIVELIWDDNIDNCKFMFNKCINITEIDLSSFNTSNVNFMQNMFYGCSSLTSLNLANFNTLKVTDMSSMFALCSSLTSLYLSNFDTSKVRYMVICFLNVHH